jgi:hypothetical protein
MQMFDSGRVPEPLLLIIAATSLRIIDPEDPRPHRWADECRRKVLLDAFLPPTQTTLQTFILLQRYEWHRGSHMSAWITSSIAVRLTHALQLNLELPSQHQQRQQQRQKTGDGHDGDYSHHSVLVSVTVREMRRRTLWACFVMESLMESGRNPFSGLDLSSIETRLPCDENSFQLGIEQHELPLGQEAISEELASILNLPSFRGRPDIPAYLARLAVLRLLILQYTAPYHPRNRGRIPEALPWKLEEESNPFYQFEAELVRWSAAFAENLRFSTDNLYRRQPDGVIGFVTFHCMFHGCYCDLYRIGSYITTDLSQRPNSTPFVGVPESFIQRCRAGRFQNAMAIAGIIDTALPHLRAEHDPFIAISACLAIRILAVESGNGAEGARYQAQGSSIRQLLQTSVKCATQTARWSVPIRKLLLALGRHAQQQNSGFDLDLSGLQHPASASGGSRDASIVPYTRPVSPSLRTYGTFGSIQSSLTKGNDSLTPAVSAGEPEESDIFVAAAASNSASASFSGTAAVVDTVTTGATARGAFDVSTVQKICPPGQDMSLSLDHLMENHNDWAEWNTTSSLTSLWDFPLGWADHSLGFDPEHDWGMGFL